MGTFLIWLPRLLPGIVSAVFFIIAFDWLQTRSLNARRSPAQADERISDEMPVAATRVYLAALASAADLGWLVQDADDQRFTLRLCNRTPHVALRNVSMIVQLSPFGSGETRVVLALNSPHPNWVRRRFRADAARFVQRLRFRSLDETPAR
jgi:hypothetical protein